MLNSLQYTGATVEGLLVFSLGTKVWTFFLLNSVMQLIALDDEFSLIHGEFYSDFQIRMGTTDGNGHSFFMGDYS